MSRSEAASVWRQRLRRFASSSMTVAQFCQSEGVSQPSFYKWRKKLGQLPATNAGQDAVEAQFLPVQLTESTEQADGSVNRSVNQPSHPPLASTVIDLPGGVRIRVEVQT